MLKLIGIGIILIVCTKIGADYSARFNKRVSSIKDLQNDIETIRTEMSFNLKPLSEILGKVDLNLDYLKKHDIEKIKTFLNSLGKSDIDTQLRNIDFFKTELAKMEEVYVEEQKKYSRLALTLGICCGSILALIII